MLSKTSFTIPNKTFGVLCSSGYLIVV